MIQRWSTEVLSTDGNDVWVEWVAGADRVAVIIDGSEVATFPAPPSEAIGDVVADILGDFEKPVLAGGDVWRNPNLTKEVAS